MNTFMNNLQAATNRTVTDNGETAYRSTNSAVYDMFAFGGAYRRKSNEDCILLFKNALEEDVELAMRCLFWMRDVRGGNGERRFFRVCYRWLCNQREYREIAKANLENIAEYGRWDDLLYSTYETNLEKHGFEILKRQLYLDTTCNTPSLLAKWLPSENASSKTTKKAARDFMSYLEITNRTYRKTLSKLRAKINIVERLMSANRWDEIEFDKIPSKAGLIYKNAFARRDIIAKKYEAFAKDENTTVNAKTLFPYDVVAKATDTFGYYRKSSLTDTDRAMLEKYWNALPDYLEGKPCKMMCVVDTSGSMRDGPSPAPIDVAISLGMYCAERIGGPFKDHYISFSSCPQLIKIEGVDFVDKVYRIYQTNLCQNTNIDATFELIRNIALQPDTKPEDIPETLIIISDMQIDHMAGYNWSHLGNDWTQKNAPVAMEKIRAKWEHCGLKMPKLVYWNVNASNPTILDAGPNVSFVSGCNAVLFKQIMTGKTGYDLMLDTIMAKRYDAIVTNVKERKLVW